MPSIVVVCGDPGGANAVAPVIELLRTENRLSVHALAYRQARVLWADRGLAHEEIPESATQDFIVRQLRQLNARLVLTGTSINQFEFEKQFIAAARSLQIPSISVLDFWSNYAQRFSDENGGLVYLPEYIAVMDQLARDEMIAERIDPSRIVITGHPALDCLAKFRMAFEPQQRRSTRRELGVDEGDWLVLYASQPPSFVDGADEEGVPPWLDRQRAVKALIGAMEALSKEYEKKTVLLIRPHPRENIDVYQGVTSELVQIVHRHGGEPHALMMSADAVVGMNTMFLVESAYLNCPTVSIRLEIPLPDSFPPNRSGLIPAVYREGDVRPMLEGLLAGRDAGLKGTGFPPDNASGDVAKLIYSMLDLK